ncbi:MAG: WYL domain-containing protein [Ruminococcus sp.]|nr:WYL domain-containing protein [Ruminococcus sp.]
MNIFTETESAYYKAAEEILALQMTENTPVTERRISEIISRTAFKDSALFIPEKLIPKADGGSPWGLLKPSPEADGGFVSVLSRKPKRILSAIQKSFLKAKLSDPRMGLFLDDSEMKRLSDFLGDVPPLYDRDIFRRFDIFTDGDDFADPLYRQVFRTLLKGFEEKKYVFVKYLSGKGGSSSADVLPLAFEYSPKNDKFRIHAVTEKGAGLVLNIGRITYAELTEETPQTVMTTEEYFSRRRCNEPAAVEVKNERNGVERFMLEFASYEKESCFDPDTGGCRTKIWYDKYDETELLIMLLSFGPVIEIISPKSLREEAARRAKRQYELFFGGKPTA